VPKGLAGNLLGASGAKKITQDLSATVKDAVSPKCLAYTYMAHSSFSFLMELYSV